MTSKERASSVMSMWGSTDLELAQLIEDAIQTAILEERRRCAAIAWKMQSERFGGTAIGNAIEDLTTDPGQ